MVTQGHPFDNKQGGMSFLGKSASSRIVWFAKWATRTSSLSTSFTRNLTHAAVWLHDQLDVPTVFPGLSLVPFDGRSATILAAKILRRELQS